MLYRRVVAACCTGVLYRRAPGLLAEGGRRGPQPGYYLLTEEVDGRERVRAQGWPERYVGRSLFDEGNAPVDDILRCTGDAEAEHRRRDEAARLNGVAFLLRGRGRGEVLPRQSDPAQ